MQVAGIDGENIILLIEDHQMVEPVFLELINSLLCAGDVPGLYTSEELEPLLSPLREQAMQEEFRGPLYAYFAHRVMKHLHVVLIMDCTSSSFTAHCEANPALYKSSSFQWMDSWSKESMLKGEASSVDSFGLATFLVPVNCMVSYRSCTNAQQLVVIGTCLFINH